MLGRKSKHAEECYQGGFIGTDFGLHVDLTGKLEEDRRTFNEKFIPTYLSTHPDKTKVAAALACGMTWTVAKGLKWVILYYALMDRSLQTRRNYRRYYCSRSNSFSSSSCVV